MSTLYKADVTEYECEAGWGESQRPDGVAFCEDKDSLVKFFDDRKQFHVSRDSLNYSLYEDIDTPTLVKVSDECKRFFDFEVMDTGVRVLWLRGESLQEFMKGVVS